MGGEDVQQGGRDVRRVERAEANAGQAWDLGDLVQQGGQVRVLLGRPVAPAGGRLAVSADVDAG